MCRSSALFASGVDFEPSRVAPWTGSRSRLPAGGPHERKQAEPMNRWNSTTSNLSPERIEALRQKIEAGDYNSKEVAETVARRILARGDLRGEFRDDRDGGGRFGSVIH
jgi:hypothetical protein